MNTENAWIRYCELMKERPELFRQSEYLEIETDRAAVEAFSRSSGREIGVVYESPYSMMVVDLVTDKSGRSFAYERVVPANMGGIVCVPIHDGRFVLLRQYRHALRNFQLAFPRGFGEAGLTSAENLRKETKEEIGADVLSFEHLGSVAPDSGMTSNTADVYLCHVTVPSVIFGYEGIDKMVLADEAKLKTMIASGKISDSFTLSAYALYCSK